MLLTFDSDADTLFVKISDEHYGYTEALDDDRSISYGEDGRPIEVEIANASCGIPLDGLPEDVREALDDLTQLRLIP